MTLDRLSTALQDRYRIERELGQGGMATVYLAEDLRHTRKVAIKVLREDLAASLGSTRFLREIQIAAQLQHPNILPLLDSGEARGPDGSGPYLFYVMPFVPGQSLRERLAREGELPVHEAVRLLVEVTDALAHSHQMGVVHRDIKPDNVMMSGRHALVTDFGVAKAISEATGRNTITTLGVAVGTPTYMSPEQASADPHIDHRSDIYAVGVMAYEMLTGRPPFTGATPQQVLAAHVTEAPDPVSKRRQAISAPLEQIVMRCLAKRPADRFQSAEELLQLLEAQATPSTGITPTQTRPVTAWTDPVGRRRWGTVAAVVVSIAALAVIGWNLRPSEPSLTVLDVPRLQVTTSGTAEIAAVAPDGQRVAYGNRVCSDDARCTYDLVIQDIGGAGRTASVTGLQAVYELDWSGNGRLLLFTGTTRQGRFGSFLIPALGGSEPRFMAGGAVRMFGDDDSLMIGTEVGLGRVAIRATVAAAPSRGDTLVVERRGLGGFGWGVSPDGRWIMVGYPVGDRVRIVLLNRRGEPLDSMEQRDVISAGFKAPGRFVLGTIDSLSTNSVTLTEHEIDDRGRFTGARRQVLGQLPIEFPRTSPGGIAYLTGTVQMSVYAGLRDGGVGSPIAIRQVASATSGLGVLMASDGSAYILMRRTDAPGGASTLTVSALPVTGGPERIIGTGIRDVLDRSRTVDGTALVLLQREGKDARILQLHLATGQSSELGMLGDTTIVDALEVMRDGSLIWEAGDSASQLRIRSPDGAIRSVRAPQTSAEQLEDSPWGHGTLGWGWSYPAGDSLVIFHLPPGANEARRLVTRVFEGIGGMRWLENGNIELLIAETAATTALYTMDPSTGELERRGIFPVPFTTAISFSNDGRHMAAFVAPPTRDVWVARWD
jgi:tRNA A-37 threonylcarbamoyl transferase component Bud32